MDRLQAMKVFTRVVETNGFSRAADTLDLPRASVTTIIQNLEAHLKVRLLQRTTRRLSLTPDGAAYYERCVRTSRRQKAPCPTRSGRRAAGCGSTCRVRLASWW
jgi:DNA-binding transcriptional LysR family regulator